MENDIHKEFADIWDRIALFEGKMKVIQRDLTREVKVLEALTKTAIERCNKVQIACDKVADNLDKYKHRKQVD